MDSTTATVKVGDNVVVETYKARTVQGSVRALYDYGIVIRRPNGLTLSLLWSEIRSLVSSH